MKPLTPKIRHYSTKQLAFYYLVSKPTFNRWLLPYKEEIGSRNGHYYTTAQVEIIFQKLGIPPMFNKQFANSDQR